jgi:capsular polysaccharide biosynthesis protein
MELKDYIRIVRKDIFLVIVLSLGSLFMALLITNSVPQGYSQTQTFFVASPKELSFQNLGPYYAQENARNFTDTAIAILESPDFIAQVSGEGRISIRKMAPQVIRITATARDAAKTHSLMQNTLSTFNSKMASISDNQYQPQLKEIGRAPDPSKIPLDKKVFAVAGFTFGLAASVVALSLKTYLKL